MKQRIAIVTGVSGVGKSSLLARVADQLPMQILSAGRLISEELARSRGAAVSYDDLRTLDIGANQAALQVGFELARDPHANTVVLDAHVAIDTPDGFQPIEATVFGSVGAEIMIFLEREPKRIFENRSRDPFRSRPLRDIETLDRQQRQAKRYAEDIASELGISFLSVRCERPDDLIQVLTSEECHQACQTGRQ
jgi:adenylate kinase